MSDVRVVSRYQLRTDDYGYSLIPRYNKHEIDP